MKTLRRIIGFASLILAAGPARAGTGLQAAGPIDPVSTLPSYYMDNGAPAPSNPAGLALDLCVDQAIGPSGGAMCILTPEFDPNPAINPSGQCATPRPPGSAGTCWNPITTTGPIGDLNFPNEIFYYLADSRTLNAGPTGSARLTVRLAIEAAWLPNGTGPTIVPNQGTTFARVLMKKVTGLTPNSTYTVQHPYGQFTFQTDASGNSIIQAGQTFRVQDPVAPAPGLYFPLEMQTLPTTGEGPFLVATTGFINVPAGCTTGAAGCNTYLGDPLAAVGVTVTGSPLGPTRNGITFSGPDVGGPGVNVLTTNLWTLAGKVHTAQIPSKLAVDRQVYSRDATSGRVDVFATALPTATLTASGAGIVTTALAQAVPSSGKFFASIPFTPVATLPTISLANGLDAPPVPFPLGLVDGVDITQADYDPIAKSLVVKAASRDALVVPTLIVRDPLDPAATTLATLTAGAATISFTAAQIPPMNIEVVSSHGGSAIAPVRVLVPPAAPVAVADSAATAVDTAVLINVIGNDTGSIAPATVVIASAPTPSGTAVANTNGTVTFTPAAGFTGQATFTYSVNDTFNRTSNAATVTVTVAAAVIPRVATDFNGDGRSDVLWKNGTDMYMWLMNADGTYTPQYVAAPSIDWSIAAVADFDGDGNSDLLWRNATTTDMYIWFMSGTGVKSFSYVAGPPPAYTVAAARDFDGDGKADLLWRNGTDMYIWFMNGASFTFAYVPGPAAPWQTVP